MGRKSHYIVIAADGFIDDKIHTTHVDSFAAAKRLREDLSHGYRTVWMVECIMRGKKNNEVQYIRV